MEKIVTYDNVPTKRFDFKVKTDFANPDAGNVKFYLDNLSLILLEVRQ